MASRNFEEFEGRYGRTLCRHTIRIRDVYDGIEESDLDVVILDIPEPQRAVGSAARSLRPNGALMCWLPTALQVFHLVRALQEHPQWARVRTTESLVRPWYVSTQSLRPAQRMVGHTGFLVSARRVETLRVE